MLFSKLKNFKKVCDPGKFNSTRIKIDKSKPIIPAQNTKNKYKDPMPLWLVEKNHLSTQRGRWKSGAFFISNFKSPKKKLLA